MNNPLKKILTEGNYTLQEIGTIIGVTRQGVYNILNDIARPSAMVLLKILTAFKNYVTPTQLLIYYTKLDNNM